MVKFVPVWLPPWIITIGCRERRSRGMKYSTYICPTIGEPSTASSIRPPTKKCPNVSSTSGGFAGRRAIASVTELLAQDTLVEAMTGIEQHLHRDRMVHADVDLAHRAHLGVVGDGGHWSTLGIEHLDSDPGTVGQQRAAPPTRSERADWRQCHQRGIDRNDRPLRR